mmetsp:Transcript_169047/g.543307  ORF Transcript_169047/g.543307 Transcript_169047/m.543307 type:complete len:102 (+) Transcript_169047:198-503(+)
MESVMEDCAARATAHVAEGESREKQPGQQSVEADVIVDISDGNEALLHHGDGIDGTHGDGIVYPDVRPTLPWPPARYVARWILHLLRPVYMIWRAKRADPG